LLVPVGFLALPLRVGVLAWGWVSVYGYPMARPKSEDPKRALTIRLRSSVLAALGGEAAARAALEAMAEKVAAPKPAPAPVAPRVSVAVQVGPAARAPGSMLKKR
jgi:hypothetical protein